MRGIAAALALALALCSAASASEAEDVPAPQASAAPASAEPAVDEQGAASELTPRGRYNAGLSQLDAADFAAAADAFLGARDSAGPDAELRYRAAFNLGLALAQGVTPESPPAEAIATLRQSAAWFNDAVRLAPAEDDDARINLELISRRILALADQLNQGNRLEARLDRLIDDQRGVRDEVRRLLVDIAAEQAATEPLGFADTFHALASRERTLMAEVGDCIDLAAEERLFIEQTPESERTAEQLGRAHQLQALADYLERARQSLSDSRRRLRRLEGERGHRRTDAALAELKRAREQLLDPVRVLQAALRDELELLSHTTALAAYRDDTLQLDETLPAWLTEQHLSDRQEDVAARSGGVLSRFEAVAAAPTGEADEQQARALKAVHAATPILERGLAAMRDAIAALDGADPAAAIVSENQALQALAQAIEQFAGIKELVELAYAGQQRVVALLDPQADAASRELSSAERAEAIFALGEENRQRLERLQPLLEEEAANAAAAAAADTEDQPDEEPNEDALQAAEQRYAQAEALRAEAAAGLATLLGEVERIADAAAPPTNARNAAAQTLTALEALRRLFFSIVEHIQALHAEQADTHDRTATLQFESSADAVEDLAAELGLAAERQAGHAQLGDALADALAQQSDAAAENAQGAPAEASQEAGAQLAEAAAEVRKAGGRMHGAGATLANAAERAGAMSPELEPALEDQLAALDHLQNALRALAPPDSQQNQGGQQSSSDNQQQAEQQPDPQEEQMSQRQALQRLQAIRDREAERRQRRNQQASQQAPVEKDW